MMVWALLIQSSESLKCRQDMHRWLQILPLGGHKPPEEKEEKKLVLSILKMHTEFCQRNLKDNDRFGEQIKG
jgi:hypothetical protein